MRRALLSLVSVIFSIVAFASCQLSPFKRSDAPPAPAPPQTLQKIISIPRPTLDFAIESRIEEVLRLNENQFSELRVASKKGLVTLTGRAPDEWYLSRLISVLRPMPGVRDVINRVEIAARPASVTRVPATAEESAFPWRVLEVGGILILISTLIWALRRPTRIAVKQSK